MVYGYIRVSTDKQTLENQKFEIKRFRRPEKLNAEKWIEEKISGTKSPDKRQLGSLLGAAREGGYYYLSGVVPSWPLLFYDYEYPVRLYDAGNKNLDNQR